MNTPELVFKRYGKNRRLYDTAAKRYVTLDELAAAIRRGAAVRVVDAETGKDLTRICLTQIIMEEAKQEPAGLPLELLRQLVVASDHVGREFIMWYLKAALDAYHRVQNALESGLSEVHSAARSPLQLVKNFVQGSLSEKRSDESELQALRQRIADLEQRLAEVDQKRSRQPRQKRRELKVSSPKT